MQVDQFQVYFKSNIIGDERFEELNLLDLGDWMVLRGQPSELELERSRFERNPTLS
ncbi:MAG: hypothetical protein Ct9H300mP15_27580 [Gemmatimonadota bacterium]|nr:MAG: hypothetical protein Ct9H300mP15_27580 [Gemmatimonadota bacterium]